MKNKIEDLKVFWDKNKKKVYIVGGSLVAAYVVGKLCGISYNVGYMKGVYDEVDLFEDFLKENIPTAYDEIIKWSASK